MNIRFFLFFLICLLPINSYAKSPLEKFGDYSYVAFPLVSYSIIATHDDKEGKYLFFDGLFYTILSTELLKQVVNTKRPNGEKHSFPSGHTAIAFQNASFLQTRYGLSYGIPAYMVASLVGYSRIEANKHYWRDVIAGGALAMGVQHLVNNKKLMFFPYIFNHHYGIQTTVNF